MLHVLQPQATLAGKAAALMDEFWPIPSIRYVAPGVIVSQVTHPRYSGGSMEESLSIQEVVRRIKGEFLEMPGLRLTPQQAQRLWRLDETACDAVLGALVDARFLARTRDGAFVRHDTNSAVTP